MIKPITEAELNKWEKWLTSPYSRGLRPDNGLRLIAEIRRQRLLAAAIDTDVITYLPCHTEADDAEWIRLADMLVAASEGKVFNPEILLPFILSRPEDSDA